MSFETSGVVRNGTVVLDDPLDEGTSVRVITRDPSPAITPEETEPTWRHKLVSEMDQREKREWLSAVIGSCPDIEEPPDLPLAPLMPNEIWSD